jgi:hypothetical protein
LFAVVGCSGIRRCFESAVRMGVSYPRYVGKESFNGELLIP